MLLGKVSLLSLAGSWVTMMAQLTW